MTEFTIEDGVRMALERYEEMFLKAKVKPIDMSDIDPLSESHGYWMTQTVLKAMKKREWSFDKVNRWVGFIQCLMCLHCFTTVKAERDITRPWLKKT